MVIGMLLLLAGRICRPPAILIAVSGSGIT
jgi:hypothetical protein